MTPSINAAAQCCRTTSAHQHRARAFDLRLSHGRRRRCHVLHPARVADADPGTCRSPAGQEMGGVRGSFGDRVLSPSFRRRSGDAKIVRHVAIVLIALMLDRPVLTLRSVTIAALLVLLFAPEAVVHPSFQMSFAATLALGAAYAHGLPLARARTDSSLHARAALWGVNEVIGLVPGSLVAGLATTPFAACHFHRLAPYDVLASLPASLLRRRFLAANRLRHRVALDRKPAGSVRPRDWDGRGRYSRLRCAGAAPCSLLLRLGLRHARRYRTSSAPPSDLLARPRNDRDDQYRRNSPTNLPWMRTRLGGRMRTS